MALPEPTPIYANGEERARKARIADALATGNRLPSDDMRDGEYFAMTHRAMLAVLATARLTPNEFQYLFALLAHTNGKQPWAIAEYPDKLPRLNDWAAWLGGMTTQQVYNIRASLHERGIIAYVEGNPAKVALVQAWESWDQSTFAPHTPRKGAGRKSKSKLSNLDSEVNQAMYITEFSPDKSPNLEVVIRQFSADASEGAIPQVSDTPLNKGNKVSKKNDANASYPDASASADAPKASTPKKPRKERRPPTPEEEYRVALIAAVEEVRDGEKAPNHGQEWKAAGDFYHMQAPLETIIACYREEMRRPSWDTKYLSLMSLKSNYGAFVRSGATNYRTAIDRARAAAAGKYDAPRTSQNGHTQPPSSPVEPETDTPLARNAQATNERLARIRREREAAEAAAKGAQS